MRKILFALVILFCISNPVYAIDNNNMPDKATLAANRMRFDSKTGDFLADGNVEIVAGDLKIIAPKGSGNVNKKLINFDEGINASGKWQGNKLNLQSGKLNLNLSDIPACKFLNGVKGAYGSMKLDADRLTITGAGGIAKPTKADAQTKFWLVNARNLQDTSRGITFTAGSIEGIVRNGNLYSMTAKNGIYLRGKPKNNGAAVTLKGDNALYSLQRGSVVVSGHVVANQGGRTLKSDSIVYFPDQNRVEALGKVTHKKDGTISTSRAEITIDLTKENINKDNIQKLKTKNNKSRKK